MQSGNHRGSKAGKRVHFGDGHFLMAKKQCRATSRCGLIHHADMEKMNYVYILDSGPHLFIGVTGDLEKRVAQPRRKLVWFEQHADFGTAVERERQLKKWNRAWKAKLVSNDNPEWRDLYQDFVQTE